MKILFLDGYFEPEQTSFSHLEKDLLHAFVNAGHTVTVVCPVPTRGIDKETAKKYSKIKTEKLYNGKVCVRRFWAPREKNSTISRTLRYIWCNFRQYATAKKLKDIDVILCDSTPPIQGLVASKLKKRLGVPVVYNLQDVFPDSLVKAGLTKEGSLLWKLGRKVENKTYKAADKIIVISEDFKRNIIAKGVPEEKIEVIYNWVDTEKVKPIGRKDNKLFDEYNLNRNDFIVLYAGNFGAAQGVQVIVDAAALLKDKKNIKFVLFGGGAEYEKIKEYAETLGLDNIIINPLLPSDRVSEVYSLGDVNLITCKKGFGDCAFPSKTWSIMACNSYVLASYDTNSELAEIINKSNCGQVVEPENPKALAEAILSMKDVRRKVNGREFLMQFAYKETCVGKYVKILTESKRGN